MLVSYSLGPANALFATNPDLRSRAGARCLCLLSLSLRRVCGNGRINDDNKLVVLVQHPREPSVPLPAFQILKHNDVSVTQLLGPDFHRIPSDLDSDAQCVIVAQLPREPTEMESSRPPVIFKK